MDETHFSKKIVNLSGKLPAQRSKTGIDEPAQESKAGGNAPDEKIRDGDGHRAIRKRAVHLARKTAKDWGGRDVSTYASSIAFYFFMSMIPLVIIVLQMISRMGLSQQQLLDFIGRLIPESAYEFSSRVVSEACRYSTGTLSVSALALLWAASKGTMALRCGLNKVYDEEERRPYPVLCLISIWYTIVMIVLFAAMLFLVFAGPVSRFLIEKMPDIIDDSVTIELWQRSLVAVLMTVIIALIYTVVPAGRRRFRRQLPGAVLVSPLWNIFSWAFSIYVSGYNTYTMFYGSLGTIAIFLFWLYCCFYIFLIGGYFNSLCGERWDRAKRWIAKRRKKKREAPAEIRK